MGGMKEMWLERIEERSLNIASILGISRTDLEKLDYRVKVDVGKEGFIKNYRVEFSENSPIEILANIDRLVDGRVVYVQPWEMEREYEYEEQFDAIKENKDFLERYRSEIENLKKLCDIKIDDFDLQQIMFRQIFVSVISAVETYLSDAFINITIEDDFYLKKFVESHPEFGKRKIEMKDIFGESEKIKETVKKLLLDMVYHKLPVIKKMYEDTFSIEFPDIKKMYEHVLMRHDLVHRAGKTKNGDLLQVSKSSLTELLDDSNEFIEKLSSELAWNHVPF